jgi:2,3,4,5-tetrahydropyridine-2-carboxylate N-succinyltransferase
VIEQADAPPDERRAWGFASVTRDRTGRVLDAWFPAPAVGAPTATASAPDGLAALAGDDERRETSRVVEFATIDLDTPPADAVDAYLRLHLLSHRLVVPNDVELAGVFGVLTNTVWTSAGPCAAEEFESTRLRLLVDGPLAVYGVDKFRRMTDYVLPTGVRIADADRVRLGAYLAPGTTVMHEGFVNYNAGTLGTSMVEGRITQGVVVGDGTDVGGGASILGTLSGGGTHKVRIGERCLLGANSGVGISLGDDCVVEAGLYLTAGTKVLLPDGAVTAARDLSGASGLLFLRNSQTGVVEARVRHGSWGGLNAALHHNA